MELLLILIILLCLCFCYFWYRKSKHGKISATAYPYKKKMLLTKTEYAFYHILKTECDKQDFLICPKVRLEDFIGVTDKENYMKYRGYIKSRHVDFIICDNKLHILCGIELDDKSHNTVQAQKIDNFKDNLFEVIDIPLYRIKVGTTAHYKKQLKEILYEIPRI